jgi:3-methylfumaryl-CoA hydratase
MGGAGDTLGSDDLSRWIGREQWMIQTLNPFPARALAAMLDHAHLPDAGDALPAAWHWLYFLETSSTAGTGPDGHAERGSFMPPIPLPRRMWAAGAVELLAPLRLGEPAEKVSRIRGVEHKQGRSGELFFVTIDHDVYQRGMLCVHEEQTLVYRAMPTERGPLPAGAAAPGASAPAAADWSRTVTIDPVLLFRFSALTYNGHRIHYDRDYATATEGYPGLVVHGPLLVVLLLDLVRAHKPAPAIKALRFRAMRPTFDLEAFSLHGRCEGPRVSLWSADGEGYVGMSATATLGEEP